MVKNLLHSAISFFMKKGFAILLIALFCCGFIPQHKAARQSAPRRSISELYAEAIKAVTIHKDTLNALVAIEAIFQQDSNYAPALSLLARLTKRPKNAAEYTERAYRQDTTNRYYLEEYGKALVLAKEYGKALPVYQKMVAKSTDPDHYRILALLLDNNKRTHEALAVLDSADVRFGRIPQLGRMRLHYLLKTGKTLTAEAEARKAVEEAPYLTENYLTLAEVYLITRRDSLVITTLQQAIKVDSLAIEPWLALGEVYQKRGNFSAYLSTLEVVFSSDKFPVKEKIEEWRKLTKDVASYGKFYSQYDALIKRLYIRHPESKDVALLYTQHLFVSGKAEEALRLCKQRIAANSVELEDFARVIELEGELNRPDSVQKYTTMALKLYPNNSDLLHINAILAYQRGEHDRAIELYKEAMNHTADEKFKSSMWCAIGDVEHDRDNNKRAYSAYKKALHYNADNSGALNNYAYFLSLEGCELERALKMAIRANELSENNPTYLDTKAWVLYKLGRYAEAKKVMQQALSLDRSRSPEYPLHYGDILYALGEEFMAKTYWRKALERGADKEEIERRFLPNDKESKKDKR